MTGSFLGIEDKTSEYQELAQQRYLACHDSLTGLYNRESAEKDRARTIVRNIIKLSHDLRMTSLTEGVETEEQFKALADMGCHLFQGFYFAKPMTDEEFEEFCRKEK